MPGETDHGGAYIWTGHKAVRWNIRHDVRLRVILDCQRQCAVVLGSRTYLHPVGYLFLNHNGDIVNRDIALKQAHDDRGGNVIRQVRYHLDRSSSIILLCQCLDIYF